MFKKANCFLSLSAIVFSATLLVAPDSKALDLAAFQLQATQATSLIQDFILGDPQNSDHTKRGGIQNCFNPERSEENSAARAQFRTLLDKINGYKNRVSANPAEVKGALQQDRKKFDETESWASSIACGNNRKCLAEGFRPDPDYVNCSPIYLQKFNQLLDQTIPSMIGSL